MEQMILEKVRRTLDKYTMFCRGLLVGFSGGADSSALLHLMKSICDENGIYLAALHVHHGIRGEEADRDAEFCLKECQKLGISCSVEYYDVPSIADKLGKGVEETARLCRYEAFTKKVNSDSRLDCVATAHNADDNAETVIYNLARGCGIDGLCGIPPVRYEKGIKVVRPLIFCTRNEIVEYLDSIGTNYIFDTTNNDTAYRRNYIRHKIMPALRELNPSLSEAISRTSNLLRGDASYIERESDRFISENAVDGSVSVHSLSQAGNEVFSRVIKKLIGNITDAMPEYKHIEAVHSLVKGGRNNTSVYVCGGVRAVIEKGMLYFTNCGEQLTDDFIFPVSVGLNQFAVPDFALLCINGADSRSYLQKDNETLQNIYKLSTQTRLNFEKINGTLFVRSRRDGDCYIFGGMTRKLKKLFNDRKYPMNVRRSLPVVCDSDGIVWVPGFPCADRVRASGENNGSLVYYSNIGDTL